MVQANPTRPGGRAKPIPIGNDYLDLKHDPAIMSQLDTNGKSTHFIFQSIGGNQLKKRHSILPKMGYKSRNFKDILTLYINIFAQSTLFSRVTFSNSTGSACVKPEIFSSLHTNSATLKIKVCTFSSPFSNLNSLSLTFITFSPQYKQDTPYLSLSLTNKYLTPLTLLCLFCEQLSRDKLGFRN